MSFLDLPAESVEGISPSSSFFMKDADEVARALLGTLLVSDLAGGRTAGVIVETEAYLGREDPASHAATKRGRTARNAAMFGPPARAYVYRSYGIHWCLNVVSGPPGDPQAVLLRGLHPIAGEELMAERRAGRRPLAAGPGRLCQALAVTDDLYGHDLLRAPLRIVEGFQIADEDVTTTGRIGIRVAADRPLRFFVTKSRGVTPGASARRALRG